MSLLVWNYRGLENLCTEDQLAYLVWAKDPSVIFLAETWTNKVRLEQVQRRIQFKNLFEVLRINKGGGLAFFGKKVFPWILKPTPRTILIPRSTKTPKMKGGL